MVKSNIEYPNLEPLFWPKSVAIVGASASDDPAKLAAVVLRIPMEHGYQGKLFPVNPKRDTIRGLKCYPSISDIPEEVDAAVIAVPIFAVADNLRECARKGVKAAVIISGGWGEAGAEGKKREDEIEEICREAGIIVCGPNTNGLTNVIGRVFLGFSPAQMFVTPGRLGWVAQSGALTTSWVLRFVDKGIGFSHFASAGNQVNVEVCDYVRYMLDDPNTDVIGIYLEGVKDVQKFLDVADLALERRKPLVVVKVGRTELAAKAAMAHTAAMAGSDLVFDAICKQKGITRANDYNDMISDCLVFLKCKPPRGDRVGIITTSGGVTALTIDHAAAMGLRLPELTLKTQQEGAKILPGYPATGELNNGFDLSAAMVLETPPLLNKTVELFVNDENIDIILAVVHSLHKEHFENAIRAFAAASKGTDKPIFLLAPRGSIVASSEEAADILRETDIPVLTTNLECMHAIKSLVRFTQAVTRFEQSKQLVESQVSLNVLQVKESLKPTGRALTEHESKSLLSRYGIPVTRGAVASSAEEAVQIARTIGYPVVLKVDSPNILHKTDVGAIKLNIRNETELATAYLQVIANAKRYEPKAEIRGVLVQEMIEDAREVIVGMSHDPQFGPTIVFGLGGVFTEILKDISLRVAPITRIDAEEMVKETKGYKSLEAFRGRPEADIDGITDTLLKLSKVSTDLGDVISEIDINPLMVLERGKGVKAADALVVLK